MPDKGQNKVILIILGIIMAIIFGIIYAGYMLLFYEEDHGDVIELKAWWRMPAIYDDYTIESGDSYIKCVATYEDGEKESIDSWEVDEPVILSKDKKVSFVVSYKGASCKVIIDPKDYEEKQPDNSDVNLSKEAQNYALAEELIVNYPGHERQYYLDMLREEGLSYEEADSALQKAGY